MYDFIHYTGSTAVGRTIMQAAATLDPEAGFTVDGTLQDLVAALPAGALSDTTD